MPHALRTLLLILAVALPASACGQLGQGREAAPERPAEGSTAAHATAEPTPPPATEAPAPEPVPAPTAEPVEEPAPWRAAWVHLFDDTLKSRSSIAELVRTLDEAGARQIIAQVARRHDAYYDSEVLPRTADPALEDGLDVVAELVEQAHAAGMEVHAWVGFAPTWHGVYEGLPAPEGWVATSHGRAAPEDRRWVTRTADGTWTEYLDPGLPQVREHYAAIFGELVERYEVDGVHLDYVRYDSRSSGYHPDALAAFQLETGTTTPPAPDDPLWSQWRRAQTQALVEGVSEAVGGAGRDVTLSAAVITWGGGPQPDGTGFEQTQTYRETLQDWPAWARAGLLDAVLPMNYFRQHVEEDARAFQQWLAFEEQLAGQADVAVVPGIGGWLNAEANAVAQIQEAVRRLGDAAMYSYQQPTSGDAGLVWQQLAESSWGAGG